MSSSKPAAARRTKPPITPRDRLARALPWLLHPVTWIRQQLRRPLRLERRGMHVHLLLGELPTQAVDEPGHGSGEALRHAHTELRRLLGRHRDAPALMRHLAYIERAIRKNGSNAFRELPLTVLHRGLAQLNSLTRGETGDGLEELRKRLGLAIEARTRDPAAAAAQREVDVSEATHSLFDEMERSWTGQMPPSGAGA